MLLCPLLQLISKSTFYESLIFLCFFLFMEGGKVLARYEQSAREFLYPTPTLTGKDGMDRELLLSRTVHFTVSAQEPLWIIYSYLY